MGDIKFRVLHLVGLVAVTGLCCCAGLFVYASIQATINPQSVVEYVPETVSDQLLVTGTGLALALCPGLLAVIVLAVALIDMFRLWDRLPEMLRLRRSGG